MIQDQIQEFTEYLEKVKHTSNNTIVSYRRDIGRMAEYMSERGITDAGDVTVDSLQDYEASLTEENFAPSSITRHNTSIKAFFRYMLENGNIAENPAESIKSPKIEKKDPRVLTAVEIENLLSQDFGKDPKGLRDKAILELMYATGLKTSEVISLNLGNVDLGLSCIRLEGKGDARVRLIPYGKKAKEAMLSYLSEARSALLGNNEDDGTVFLNCSGTPMSRQGLWKLIKNYVLKAGVKSDITPFTLRHSFAVHLVDNGADAASVQELMGYSGSNTISRYIKKDDRSRDPYGWARIRN
jgi:integrase/recombinase XerD